MNLPTNSRSSEKGFTLVELAIVMIIIGLLIGGILKGQELIGNARLSSSVSKVKAIDAAMNTFRDSFAGLPGDLTNVATRVPNCNNRCATNGNGNLRIDTVGPGASQAATSENLVSWAQLAATDLLGGIRDTAAAEVVAGNVTNPSAEIPGQFYVGYAANVGALTVPTTTAAVKPGHYLLVHNGAGGAAASAVAAATTASLTPNQAERMDTKLDDGLPNTGSVIGMGTTCAAGNTTAAAANVYNAANEATVCGAYIRIQQ